MPNLFVKAVKEILEKRIDQLDREIENLSWETFGAYRTKDWGSVSRQQLGITCRLQKVNKNLLHKIELLEWRVRKLEEKPEVEESPFSPDEWYEDWGVDWDIDY